MKSALITASMLLLFSTTLFANDGHAITLQTCADNFEVFDNTQVQTMESGGLCYVSVHPRNVIDLIYRDFLFDSAGLFMVFDSYGQGSESQTTAARNYHFFPRKNPLGYKYIPESQQLQVQTPSGKVLTFNTVKSILIGMSGARLGLDYRVHPDVRGGVEIEETDGLFMDGGFQRGQSPSQNPKSKVVFKDARKNSCALSNQEVYRYTSDNDAIFKYNDTQLKTFLASRCPKLQF